jgi:TolB-like protein/tetratricopeptide (TPR) repeat protein
MALESGQTLLHYRIAAKIGAGGMGDVYRAEDSKLGREVALKVLPNEMASDPRRLERFRREARAVAALNHPNIVTIYSVEEADGIHFLTMELVEGEALDRLIPEDGLEVGKLYEIAIPLAEAIAAAHERGIVHRDLKPANVMVGSGGRVKVLDFGLAKLEPEEVSAEELSAAPTLMMTREGVVMGTAPYMSPEQAKGSGMDHRTDIFSLGIMLYEMAAGSRPFGGSTAIELVSAILKDTPRPLSEVKTELPSELGQLVRRCLEKQSEHRYQSAGDIVAELKKFHPASSSAARGAIAVDSSRLSTGAVRRGFVGRAAERSRLDQMLDEAKRGRGGLVLLGGEPGVGKTRLASEILEDGREKGMLALVGHAYEDETAPFITGSEILEEMVRLLSGDELRSMLGENASEISRLLPELRQLYPDIPKPIDMPPGLQQRHLFKNVLEFLIRSSSKQAMVMLLDDLHWADESSLGLLEHLAPHLPELPILMVGTYRDVDADIGRPFARSMATLVRQRLAERIQIKPFEESSVAAMLSALGGSGPPAPLVHAILDATEGNVFFIEEIFRHLSEEELIFDDQGHWLPAIDVAKLDVPEGVRLVTARRLERLSELTQRVLSVASVIGLRFSVGLLEAASPDGDGVLEALEEAEAARLLQPAEGGRELRYEFVHALARQTRLSALSPLRIQRLHLSIADAIEGSTGGQPERRAAELAHHLVEASASANYERTVGWLMIAGKNAVAAAAMEEALQNFESALTLLGDGDKELRADLLHQRGAARLPLGLREGFVADLGEAFDSYESMGLGEKAATVVSELSYMLAWNGRPADSKVLIARALTLIGDRESLSRCKLLTAQGLALSMSGDAAGAEKANETAVRIARSLEIPELLAEALQNHSLALWQRLDGVTMERTVHEAAAIHREMQHEWNLGQCLWMEQAGFVFQGKFDEAERLNDELHPLAKRNEDVGSLACSALMNCVIEQARGNLEESSRQMRRSIDLFEAGNFPWGFMSEGHYSVNALLAGEVENARTAFELAGANILPGVSWSGTDTCYWLSGKAWLGDPDAYSVFEAERYQLPEPGEAKRSGAVLFLMGAIEALTFLGRGDEAAELYPAMRDVVTSGSGVVSFTYGLHERFAGMAAAAGKDWEAAERHFKKALQLAEDLPHRVDQARVRYWYARMLLDRNRTGDTERARGLLSEARELSESMGLRGLLDQIEQIDLPAPKGQAVPRGGARADTGGATGEAKVHSQASRIAVLPLKHRGGDPNLETFAEGLIEDITSGLSRFDHLQVVARSSTLRFRDQSIDIRSLGESLGARYLLEGSVRQAGGMVRVSVQLVEASTGTQLWAETYDRELAASGS